MFDPGSAPGFETSFGDSRDLMDAILVVRRSRRFGLKVAINGLVLSVKNVYFKEIVLAIIQ